MAELPRRARRLMVILHVVASVGWLGAGAANLALAVTAHTRHTVPHGGLATAPYQAIQVIDAGVVIPAAFTSLGSGLVLSLFTPWGLAKHWWVLVKLVLTLAIIGFSTFGIGVWVEQLAVAPPRGADGARTSTLLIIGAIANLTGFTAMTWLSLTKPRGLTPWSRKK